MFRKYPERILSDVGIIFAYAIGSRFELLSRFVQALAQSQIIPFN